MRAALVLLGVFAFVSACDSHPRQAKVADPSLDDVGFDDPHLYEREECYVTPRAVVHRRNAAGAELGPGVVCTAADQHLLPRSRPYLRRRRLRRGA